MDREAKIKLITSLSVCVIFVLVLIIVGQVVSILTLKNKQRQLQAEREKLEQKQTTIEELIAYRESDQYVEQIAREYLNMKKEEES